MRFRSMNFFLFAFNTFYASENYLTITSLPLVVILPLEKGKIGENPSPGRSRNINLKEFVWVTQKPLRAFAPFPRWRILP